MPNRLLLRDRKKDPWKNANARIIWEGGGQDKIWVNSNGTGEFGGSGVVSYIDVAGEKINIYQRVDGNSTIVAISQNTH